MKQRQQSRIQVLNTVLEHHLAIGQAAEIMGVSERHTKRLLAAYRKDGPAALAHGNRGRRPHNAVPEDAAAAVVKLASNGYAGANHSHFTELLREREGDRPEPAHSAPHIGEGRPGQPPQSPVAAAPVPAQAHAPGGHAGADRRQPPSLAGGAGTQVRDIAGRGRRHRHCGPGGLPYHRGHPGLPCSPGGAGAAVGDPPGPVQRSPRRLQVQRSPGAGALRVHPVRPGDAGTGHPADLRPFSPGQGTCRADGVHLPGPAGHRAAAGRRYYHGRGQCRPAGISAPLQRSFLRGGGAAGAGLPAGTC